MPSAAHKRFRTSQRDIDQLAALHDDLKPGNGPGAPKVGAGALNKASIIFICAVWEAYCEDLVEATSHVITHLTDPIKLSKGTRHSLTNSGVGPWDLAGNGWKVKLSEHIEAKAKKLNTPNSTNIDNLFSTGTGLAGVSNGWKWQNRTSEQARRQLNQLVSLRGALAHGQKQTVQNSPVQKARILVEHLVDTTDTKVNEQVHELTGTRLFSS